MRTLYIIGTGGFAKEVGQLASHIQATKSTWSSIEYVCEHQGQMGVPMPFGTVTSTDTKLKNLSTPADYVIGIGSPKARQRIAASLSTNPYLRAPNLIHPLAGIDAAYVQLGQGNIITRGVEFTCDIKIGDHNIFNLNSTVGHDVRIGSYCVINPGCNVSGGVNLGDECLLGTGCRILENLNLCSGLSIGSGAVVTRSIEAPGIYVGMPARRLEK